MEITSLKVFGSALYVLQSGQNTFEIHCRDLPVNPIPPETVTFAITPFAMPLFRIHASSIELVIDETTGEVYLGGSFELIQQFKGGRGDSDIASAGLTVTVADPDSPGVTVVYPASGTLFVTLPDPQVFQ
jgi:hypothetical protein